LIAAFPEQGAFMVQFAVTLKDTQWTVFKDGVPINQGMSRSAAVAMAEAMAFEAEFWWW
jgi:hypothetical protein